jgi:hypothetical protein
VEEKGRREVGYEDTNSPTKTRRAEQRRRIDRFRSSDRLTRLRLGAEKNADKILTKRRTRNTPTVTKRRRIFRRKGGELWRGGREGTNQIEARVFRGLDRRGNRGVGGGARSSVCDSCTEKEEK